MVYATADAILYNHVKSVGWSWLNSREDPVVGAVDRLVQSQTQLLHCCPGEQVFVTRAPVHIIYYISGVKHKASANI